jgi:hypothetical protein
MRISSKYERKKLHSFYYKKTIIRLQSLVVFLSCCFGFICFSLYFHHNIPRFDQHSAGVHGVVRAGVEFQNGMDQKKSRFAFESIDKNGSSVAWSSVYDYDRTSFIHANQSFFGHVMREFACRVLSRHVTSSNVLVVAPGAVSAAKDTFDLLKTKQQNFSIDLPGKDSIGGTFLQYGAAEGHTIYAIDSSRKRTERGKAKAGPTLDAWWRSFDDEMTSNNATKLWWSAKSNEKPDWILLAVFDSEYGSEDSVWEKAGSFLQDCTITYIVIAVRSIKLKDGSYKFGGMDAIESLLHRKYKLQTLSSSHYHAEKDNAEMIFERYGPSALFQSSGELKDFLRWGADAANEYGKPKNELFTGYIFATQGLDLAIPSPQVYLREGGTEIDVFNKYEMNHLPPLKSCKGANGEKLNFVFDEVSECGRFHSSSLDEYFGPNL